MDITLPKKCSGCNQILYPAYFYLKKASKNRKALLGTTYNDEDFKKCWSLDNLRPLSAKQNLLDGNTRIRHYKVSDQND